MTSFTARVKRGGEFDSPRTRKVLERVLTGKLTKTEASRRLGVSRKTIYKWLERYAELRKDPTTPPLRGARKAKNRFKRDILRIVAANPKFGPKKISEELKKRNKKLSVRSVWLVLRQLNLSTSELRQDYAEKYRKPKQAKDADFPVHLRLTSETRKRMVEEVILAGRKVIDVCAEFQVPRKTFAKWKRRYLAAQKAGENILLALSDAHPEGSRHPRGASEQAVQAVLDVVIETPELSSHKIAEKLGFIGNHGAQNVLKRNNLNLYELRFAYSKARKEAVVPEPAPTGFLDRIRLVWEQFIPSLAPAPPPERRKRFLSVLKIFSTSALVSFLLGFSTLSWIRLLGAVSVTSAIGLIFATVALILGSVFFLYSLKYYITLAIVLSFSQQDPTSHEASRGKKGFVSWLLGFANGPTSPEATRGKAIGLEPSLEHITLKRYPKISVHIPLYNERNVVERLIAATTAFGYKGEYEVILADDSTDETSTIIRNHQKSFGKLRTLRGDGWELKEVEVRPGVTLKHLHRTSRSGYKGGALRLALKVTDPRAEFVSVFDADFVPYPDTLTLFLKYFQATAGSLEFKKRPSDQVIKKGNEDNSITQSLNHSITSPIAAVQGYQWHVLNKSENWITRGVRSEYAGSYVIERSGTEIYSGLKQISGAVYMIRRDVLDEIGWETSITEDFQLTLKLYEKGYKVVYTPYIQAPAECVSTLKRLIRQRMRWAEGHSNNIRRMFIRLIYGQWSMANGQKEFTPSPLTPSEKLEFLYLSPYYLQAFLFLVGTISWLISETLFQAGLPFWTSLWGWSLVLTNLLSLPLMNSVGLFLEESEEKDYAGIFSFILLSYIVVPFQAYASIKGFLQKEEGPWFRTPKTGLITDVFTRGRFYRFISGILPGRTHTQPPAVAQSMRLSENYLALSTSNNTFNTFNIKSRKGQRWIGKLLITVLLLVSTTLVSYAPFIPTADNVDIPLPGSGIILSPEDKQSFFPDLSLVREAHAKTNDVDISIDTSFFLKTAGLKLSAEAKDFTALEKPEFAVKLQRNVFTKIATWLTTPISTDPKLPEVKVTVIDNDGRKVEEVEVKENGSDSLDVVVNPDSGLATGKYSIIVQDGKGNGLIQDFTWGVLAINTNKSIYTPGETAKLSMAVLDEGGKMVCDASLKLQITNDKLQIDDELSTADPPSPEATEGRSGTIRVNPECHEHAFTLNPDYESEYRVDGPGTYAMELSATTENGTYRIRDAFEVRESVPFDIERSSATRIYPPETYPVTLTIKANQDFEGIVQETVPAVFEILDIKIDSEWESGNTETLKITENTGKNEKLISWEVDWKAGETYELSYEYDAPDKSPAFYLLGPLALFTSEVSADFTSEVFRETRQWQLAIDATTGLLYPEADGFYDNWDNGSVNCTTGDCSAAVDLEAPGSGECSDGGDSGFSDPTSFAGDKATVKQSFDLNESGIPDNSIITAVNITACMEQQEGGASPTVRFFARHGTTDYDGIGTETLTTTWTEYSENISGLLITKTAGSDLEIGIEHTAGDKTTRVTEMWATVTYSEQSSPNATAWSFQRKTFWDATEDVYWRFYYDGAQINIDYNATPWTTSWTATTALGENTSDFSVWDDDTDVYIAYLDTFDIRVQKGSLNATSITWGGENTALNGSSSSDAFQYAFISKDTSGFIWVIAQYTDGTNYYMRAIRSDNANDVTVWTGTVHDISSTTNTDANAYGVIAPLASQDMYAIWIRGTAIEGRQWDDSAAGDKWDPDKASSPDSIATGQSGLANNISAAADTNDNVHLVYIDASNFVQYLRCASVCSGTFANSARLDSTATNEYVSISVDSNNDDLYAIWLRSSTAFYNKYSGSWGGETDTAWTEGTSPKHLTSNYSDPGRIFAEWTSGSDPYDINWDYIIIPENLWLFFGLAPFLPLLLKRRKKKLYANAHT